MKHGPNLDLYPRDFLPYHVIGGTAEGAGLTPGLALRDFWRAIEREWLTGGDATDVHFLPRRRFRRLWQAHFGSTSGQGRTA